MMNPHNQGTCLSHLYYVIFQQLFALMTSKETATLPRRKGAVMLGAGQTIGRHGTKGKETYT